MFAALNLHLTATSTQPDGPVGIVDTSGTARRGGEGGELAFSQLLNMRVDRVPEAGALGGESLPEHGKSLPPVVSTDLIELQDSAEGPRITLPTELPAATSEIDLNSRELSDREFDLAIKIAYVPAEPAVDKTSHVAWPPVARSPDGELKAVRVTTENVTTKSAALLPPEPLAKPPEVGVALAAQTRNLTVPMGDAGIHITNADGVIRDRSMPVTQPVPLTGAAIADATLSADTAPRESPIASLIRTGGGVETVQRPDTRIAGATSTQALTPAHLTPAIAQFLSESPLSRGEPLLETISTPVRDLAWGEKLSERVLMLTANQVKTAEIRLSPADLGPLRVQVSMDDGATNVTFHAQHAVTREAIEQALPRLREMLAESGLSLGQADVSEQGVADGNQERASGSSATTDDREEDLLVADPAERRKTVTANYLLDTFA